jgi:adhesin transport system membrane fusion protein
MKFVPTDPDARNPRLADLVRETRPVSLGENGNVMDEDEKFVQDARDLAKPHATGLKDAVLILSVAFIAAFLWWASRAELEEVSRGMGKVIPSSSVQVIQSLEGGIIDEIKVKEGETVTKDQELLRIHDAIFASNYHENLATTELLRGRLVRLLAEANGQSELKFPPETRPDIVEKESMVFRKKLADDEATRLALSQRLDLASRELSLLEKALVTGAVSPVEVIRIEKEIATLDGQIATLRTKREREAMEQYDVDKARLETLTHAIARDRDRLARTVIRSPVNGVVNKIYIDTVGRVVASGMDIMDIVPTEDTLLIEASVKPADIAFIGPGQEAMVKFTAYDFATYGGMKGHIEQISGDTIKNEKGEQFYQIKVRTESAEFGKSQDGKNLTIIPGMVAEVDILTGRKTVLQYLATPITRAKERALRER